MGRGILLGIWRYPAEDSLARFACGSVEILQGSGTPLGDIIRCKKWMCQWSGPLTPRMVGCYDLSLLLEDLILATEVWIQEVQPRKDLDFGRAKNRTSRVDCVSSHPPSRGSGRNLRATLGLTRLTDALGEAKA